ncbi:MAG TPA: PaaI family thioesterase [Geobacteraceae bacterium]
MTTMLESIRKMIDSGKPFTPLAEHLGFRVKSVELGQALIEFEMKKHHTNTMGTLHGGVLSTIADTAMGWRSPVCWRRENH